MFFKNERLALFIDGLSTYSATKSFEYGIDYKLLHQDFMRRGKLLCVDHIVLFSGDGEFVPLVASLQRQGVRVSVVSTNRSPTPAISVELRRKADNFIDLKDLQDVIGRPAQEVST